MQVCVGLLAACGSEARPLAEGAPNVLLVSLDSARRDRIGARVTPHIDRLASEGVVFEAASSTTSWTLPAHVSLFTGLADVAHGVDLDGHRASEDLPWLVESLSRAGYRTAGFFSGPYLEPRFGFARGFARYEAAYGDELRAAWERAERAEARLAERGTAATTAEVEASTEASQALEQASHRDSSARRVTDAVLAELDEAARADQRFFVFAHYFDPHYDYTPPAPFDRRFDPDYTGAIDGRDFYTRADVATFVPVTDAHPSGRARVVDERDLEHLIALYDGEIAATDEQLGRILVRLDELGLANDTLVVVLADHGDEFFEHDGIGHRRTLFEEVLAIPLVLRWPARIPPGARSSATVSIADVAATVLDAAGITASRASLFPLATGASDAVSARGALARIVNTRYVDETFVVDGTSHSVACTRVEVREAWRDGTLKITRERAWLRAGEDVAPALDTRLRNRSAALRAEERLSWIDLARDPGERSPSTDFSAPRARAALDAFRAEYARLLSARREPRLDATNEALASALAGLGYVSVDATEGVVAASELVLPLPGEAVVTPRD